MDNSVISAIDNHNVANGDGSWFDQKISATGELISDIGEGITKGGLGAVVAGVNSFINSGIKVANLVGADVAPINTYEVLSDMDSNLGDYYKAHEGGIETAGFLAGSLIPGLGGIGMLRAAQAGVIGVNVARSAGLMTSLTSKYATAAKIEFAASNSAFSILETNTVKALASGFGAQAIEAAAFETAVAGTMFESPMLKDQGAKDIFWNMSTGILLGGGIGGILHGVGTVAGIKKAGTVIDRELFPYAHIKVLDDTAPSDLKIINYFQQKFNMPDAQLAEGITTDLDPAARLALINTTREGTNKKLDVLIRGEFNKFAGNDEMVGQQLFETFQKAKTLDDVTAGIIHAKGASRIGEAESLVHGDVIFPTHKISMDVFNDIAAGKQWQHLFVPTATESTQGYRVIGKLEDLKVASYDKAGAFANRDSAFAAGYDVYRNANGVFSVNSESKILQSSELRRTANNVIVDLENDGNIVSKGTAGLADLATKAKPVVVRGDTVLAGDTNPVRMVDTLKYNPSAGSHLEAQARYIWAREQNGIRWENKVVGENDLPLLERAYYDADKAKGFIIKSEDGTTTLAPTGERLKNFIEAKKIELAQKMDGIPLDEMGLRLNVTDKWLSGEAGEFARIRPGVDYNIPRYAKMDFEEGTNAQSTLDANKIFGAVEYERQVQLIRETHTQNFANFAKDMADAFPESPNWADPGRTPTRDGSGASLFGFANSNYGTAGGWAQFTGQMTNRLKMSRQTEMLDLLRPAFGALAQAGPEAIAEASLINNRLLRSPDAWVFHPLEQKLIPRKDYNSVLKGGKPSEEISIASPEVADFLKTTNARNAERQMHVANLKGAAGFGDDFDNAVAYPVPVDTAGLKHFVFVKPRGITLGDKKRIIAAKDEKTLLDLIKQVDRSEFDIVTKAETEEWHKAIGDYDFALGLNESVVDSTLKREGHLSQHFPTIDKNFLDRVMDWNVKQEDMLTTSMVAHRYSQSFQELSKLGESYTNIATSQFRSLTDALKESVKDPYKDVVRTALDISRASEYQIWKDFNSFVKDSIEQPINKIRSIFADAKQPDADFIAKVNNVSERMGMGKPFETTYAAMVANKNIADKPWLAQGIQKAQGIMSASLLQLDFFNAINNTIGSPIILSAEVSSLIKGIQKANPEVAGKLANLMKVAGPEGLETFTTGRLIKQALENYRIDHIEGGGLLLKRYQDIGAITDVLQQERQMINELTFDWTETAGKIDSKTNKAFEFGKKWTGNKLAEEMTRFISADVMRQITDYAVEAGVLQNFKQADEYISLFVNRTQGNYLHSQRPIVFQGVVGQAISLFQTYQFNLMQQLFRYVGEGDKKAIGMLLGLQGSIYGMQGLPAFNFLNTHIVGNASGNTNHKDLYQATNTVFGKQLGDWLLYGAGSNALGLIDSSMRFNLYSRGDINPRQISVLPTQIEDVPVIAASVRFVKNLYGAAEKVGSGGAFWPTMSQALEHNGLSRPLSGLAQIAQGYTTTNQGSLLTASRDFYNVATLTRVGGGKPFDEAVALDSLYRINAYRAKDTKNIQELGAAVKTTVVGGGVPTETQMTTFLNEYARSGGRVENFNKFMSGVIMSSNRSQVNAMAQKLNSPFAAQIQVNMGGIPLPDYVNQPAQK